MSTSGNNIGQIPMGNILLLVSAIIGGVLFHSQAPLESHRPELEARSDEPSKNKVISRLWEDPFDVLVRWEADSQGGKSGSLPDLISDILARKSNVLAVPVIMNSAHYPETREGRIQQRYAVLAALNVAGYTRNNADVMGVGRLEFEDASLLVPYEWFSSNKLEADRLHTPEDLDPPDFQQPDSMTNAYADVCIMWLHDDFLKTKTTVIREPGQGPLSEYRQLTAGIRGNANTNLEVRIVGPRSSSDIQRILKEIKVLRCSIPWFTNRIDQLNHQLGVTTANIAIDPLQNWVAEAGADNEALEEVRKNAKDRKRKCRKMLKKVDQKNVSLYWILDLIPSEELPEDEKEAEAKSSTIGKILDAYAAVLEAESKEAHTKQALLLFLAQLEETRERMLQSAKELSNLKAENKRLREEAEGRSMDGSQDAFERRYGLELRLEKLKAENDFLYGMITNNLRSMGNESVQQAIPKDNDGLRSAIEEWFKPDGILALKRARCQAQYERSIKDRRKDIGGGWWFNRDDKRDELADVDRKFREAYSKVGQTQADIELHTLIMNWHALIHQQYTDNLSQKATELRQQIADYEELVDGIHLREKNINQGKLSMQDVLTGISPLCSLFSPWATADYIILSSNTKTDNLGKMLDEVLASRKEGALSILADLRTEVLRFHRIHFNRTIHKDSRVLNALIDELKRRGVFSETIRRAKEDGWYPTSMVRLDHAKEHIVLIGEWDSLFTRALSLSFALEYNNLMTNWLDKSSVDHWPEKVHMFSYLRGLDGLIPGDKHDEAPKSSDASDKQSAYAKLGMRYPDGTSQYDYLRRLADRIQRMETHGEKVKAVGIFGSDPYDKLLVLRALRKNVPDAVYFTTDLDARFAHPSEMKWTRGLVVGSSYGLQLHPDIQKSTPPFRNAYQTSVYATMLTVLKGRDWVFNIDDYEPRIFEIGYNGPYDLSASSTNTVESKGSHLLQLHPRNMNRWSKHARKIKMAMGLALVLPTLILALTGFCWARTENPGFKGNYIAWIGFTLVGLASSGYLYYAIRKSAEEAGGGEPLAFTEGISIWPSLILRMLVFVLSIYFMLRHYFSIRSDRSCIPKIFNMGHSDHEKTKTSLIRYLYWPFRRGQPEGNVASLWEEYSSRRKIGLAYLALFILAVLYGRLGYLIVGIDPPYTPFRGHEAFSAHMITLRITLLAMTMLCGTAIYTLLRCSRFIDCLYTRRNGRCKSRSWIVLPDRRADDATNHLNNVRLIGRVTETTGRVVVSPFIVLFLMILTRYEKIDLWDWPIPLMFVVGLTVLGSLIAAVQMRYKAKQVQKIAIDELKREQIAAPERKDIQLYIKECEACDRGAFAPLANNPILLAVLTPFGGVGAIAIIQNLMSSF